MSNRGCERISTKSSGMGKHNGQYLGDMSIGSFWVGVILFSHESESRRHVVMSWQLHRDALERL
jgi:hypothetical protein